MTVYVDLSIYPLGRMMMCHMMADTIEELHEMADLIGVERRHFQGDHYDICKAKRQLAVKGGAVEISGREMVRVRQRNRGKTNER
ncbi:MAG: DUF4031 domain-containing protein [Nitrososphaerales archaeon]